MDKLTISRLGQEKIIETKFGPKKKTGVQFKEYGDIWHDIWAGDLKEGQVVEGTRASREYQGKIYWNFNFPKKDAVSNQTLESILKQVTTTNLMVREIYNKTFPSKIDGTNVDYPTPESEGIDSEDVPF